MYFIKKDSADGRLLIWQCSLNMVADKPVFGHGHGAFQAKYMYYQAEYMNAHPENRFASLADNVLHPFNEYLLVLTEHGCAGFCIVILLVLLIFRAYHSKPDEAKLTAMMSILALAVFSFFSYPFRYPFTWLLLFLNISVIYNSSVNRNYSFDTFALKRFIFPKIYLRIITCLLSVGLLMTSVTLMRTEMKWKRIARFSLGNVLPEYDKLYRWLGKDGLFLYNHAAELYEAKEYEKSLAVFEQSTRYHNDMDVQMFLAANYSALGKYVEAEQHYKMAADMCPARFRPLYELAKLYDDVGRVEEACDLAKKIIDKDVKVPSFTIDAMKKEMRLLIEVRKTADEPASEVQTFKPSGNEDTKAG